MVIFVVGKIGVGKSTISKYVSENYDFEFIEIDKLAKTIYDTPDMYRWLHENIPNAISDDNVIDFSVIRSIIFRDSVKNSSLLKISLPILARRVKEITSQNPDRNYVIESFMSEVSNEVDVSKYFIILASNDAIKKRVLVRDKRPPDETDKILSFQDAYIEKNFKSPDSTFDFSNFVFIDNDNGVDQEMVFRTIDNELHSLLSK
jgi:dephospho-CoA kinase